MASSSLIRGEKEETPERCVARNRKEKLLRDWSQSWPQIASSSCAAEPRAMASLDDRICVVYTTGFACACNLDPVPAGDARAARSVFAAQVQERESQMMKAATARQQKFTPERDEARCELARGLPLALDWRNEARRALASDHLTIDGNGRIIRTGGAPTGFMLDPLPSGRQVYIRDECGTRY